MYVCVCVCVLKFALPSSRRDRPGDFSSAPKLGSSATCFDSTAVSISPRVPRAGSAFEVRLRGADPKAVQVELAGVALVPRLDSGAAATLFLAPAPIDSVSGIDLLIRCMGVDGPSTFRVQTKVGLYRMERLTVAPSFGAAPSKAVSELMSKEAALAANASALSMLTTQLWSKPFIVPRASRITSGFGNGRTFNGQVVSRHMGTDYSGAKGSAVVASNRGVVRIVDSFYLGGNVIYLDHGAGVMSAYLHLSRQLVSVGDTVARGDTIGRVGATGRVTGPHLHFITRVAGITVDPASIIGRR